MNPLQILSKMEKACPIKCYCSMHTTSQNDLELLWNYKIRGTRYYYSETITPEELTDNEQAIEMRIYRARYAIRFNIENLGGTTND